MAFFAFFFLIGLLVKGVAIATTTWVFSIEAENDLPNKAPKREIVESSKDRPILQQQYLRLSPTRIRK
jgi:hypothetical protein